MQPTIIGERIGYLTLTLTVDSRNGGQRFYVGTMTDRKAGVEMSMFLKLGECMVIAA